MILAKAKGKPETFKYSLWYLTRWAETSKIMGMDEVFVYLVEEYYLKGKATWLDAEQLSKYINNPRVTVSVNNFSGPLSEQVRVIGEATNPSAVNYTEHMTLLDLMIAVGGLTEFASGNNAKLVRVVDGKQHSFNVKIDDLIRDGDISENVDMLPGDIVIIPEAWF